MWGGVIILSWFSPPLPSIFGCRLFCPLISGAVDFYLHTSLENSSSLLQILPVPHLQKQSLSWLSDSSSSYLRTPSPGALQALQVQCGQSCPLPYPPQSIYWHLCWYLFARPHPSLPETWWVDLLNVIEIQPLLSIPTAGIAAPTCLIAHSPSRAPSRCKNANPGGTWLVQW